MNILVTGAAGFIGSHISDRLLADGHEVVGVDNLLTGRADNFAGELHVEDICDRDVLYGIANKVQPELIIHCAASYSNPGYWHRDTDTNVTGTINTTIAALHHGARLLYFQTALPPISSYAISKIAGEQYIVLSGVEHTIFRLANMYGPRNLSGPIPTFYKRLTERMPCTIVDTTRDMVYVADLVECVMCAVSDGLSGSFDVCSGTQTPIAAMYQAVLAELTGSAAEWMEQFDDRKISGPPLIPPASDDVQTIIDPAKGVPGWKTTVGIRDGVAYAVDWYRRAGVEQTHTHLRVGSG